MDRHIYPNEARHYEEACPASARMRQNWA